MTVGENIFLGKEPAERGAINWNRLYADTQTILTRYKLDIQPQSVVRFLGVGRYQQKLLGLLQHWQQSGVAVIFSSNNLDHLFAVADRIIVLRQGRKVADYRADTTSREEVVAAMVSATDRQQLTPIIWALDSYYHARDQAEQLSHQQRLLEQNLAARDSHNRQLVEQLARQVARSTAQTSRSKTRSAAC
jgi:ABC-type sugar transport system ATPase subunit